ncbi:hypothetical protein [Actinacidiphila bryophytorum]|uniref:Uncharacterized protein n=1 Tax=Actinacidiphila bryophytorum TaxID=1436133 RepID=A0A9W4H3S0_9ACTN|nr:hypothetical protein [Actinacidiphila bryophytorum]MBM9436018.1 hypothetical protein [Actinacidiphila bryophytorum]MBN6546180.1 hypothetical protein [Actinacidiphila bryophytorum]CAG7649105.1 conserved hypothetical protein [Actinacidiphila bryophytorum]
MSDQNPYGDNSSYSSNGSNPQGDPRVQKTSLPSYQPTMPALPGYGVPPQNGTPPPAGAPGWQHGGLPQPQGGPGATLLTIGDIAVTETGIMTPAGLLPLRGAVWTVSDMSRSESKTPTYAIVLAVIFALACLVGLFFLLIKENVTTGFAQVTVNSGGKYHAVMIPVRGPQDIYAITQQVNYARSLSA